MRKPTLSRQRHNAGVTGRIIAGLALMTGAPLLAAEPLWIVPPTAIEPDLPVAGHSQFDALIAGPFQGVLPFPFRELSRRLGSLLDADQNGVSLRQVLIPAGRSLQRGLSGGDGEHPRVVLAVTADSRADRAAAGLVLRDRLYIAYHEPAATLEVISYNESMGRFEFQVVTDYRRDTRAKVFYAPRQVCRSCHHNAAPIFSRGDWGETNAHRGVSARIGPKASTRYGVPAQVSIDEPAGLDASTDRANQLAVAQFVWSSVCGSDGEGDGCRAELLGLALRALLTGMNPIALDDGNHLGQSLRIAARRWSDRWPHGVALPDGNLPNRTPALIPILGGAWANHVARDFDPLILRRPREIRRALDRTGLAGTVRTLTTFFDNSDARRFDALARAGGFGSLQRRSIEAVACREDTRSRQTRAILRVSCQGLTGIAGVDRIELRLPLFGVRERSGHVTVRYANARLAEFHLQITGESGNGDPRMLRPVLTAGGLSPRLANGDRIAALRLGPAEAEIPYPRASSRSTPLRIDLYAELNDLAARVKRLAKEGDALGPGPFQRRAVLEGIGLPVAAPAGLEASAPRLEPSAGRPVTGAWDVRDQPAIAAIYRRCGACHSRPVPDPVNFLAGPPTAVRAALRHCAPRMRYRLAMWELSPSRRGKSPMPPALSVTARAPSARPWPESDDFRVIREFLQRDGPYTAAGLPLDGADYETLPPCVSERARATGSGIRNPSLAATVERALP